MPRKCARNVEYVCGQCGTTFLIPPSQIGKRSTCSRACKQLARKKRPPEERFWAKVLKTDGCWLWQGSTSNRSGYGQFNAVPHRPVRTHRFAWELLKGSIPDGLEVCHNCPGGDNPRCVNPDHLFLGTHADNMRDAGVKGQMARGDEHPHAKLTEEAVREIRRQHADGIKQAYLAWYYGVSASVICEVISRKMWKHVS